MPAYKFYTVLIHYTHYTRYVPSQSDVAAFNEVSKCPSANHTNAARWYRQIASYSSAERSAFPGAQQPAVATAEDDEDDDDGLLTFLL